MALTVRRDAGLLLLGIYLVLVGISGFTTLGLPSVLMAAVALIAGVLIILGR